MMHSDRYLHFILFRIRESRALMSGRDALAVRKTMTGWQVGIDIGDIFTDLVALLPGTGEARSIKIPTQWNDPVASIKAAFAAAGLSAEVVADLVHGTTLVTNAAA